MIAKGFTEPTERVKHLKRAIVDAIPYVESERAVLVTESYKETEGLSPIMRRAKAAEKIFNNLPITIHDDELIVGAIQQRFVLNFLMTGLRRNLKQWAPEWRIPSRYQKRPRHNCMKHSNTGRERLPVL